MFKFGMIVDDSFYRLNERMIVHDSFSASGLVKNGLKPKMATAVLSSEEEQSHNSDYSDAESEKAKTPKKSRKVTHEKWSGGLISKLIDEYEARPCLWNIFCHDYHNRDVTGKAKKELEEIFNRSWKDISNQLTKLRQILGQNINKIKNVKSGQSTDELFQPTWRYWKQLQFLVPCMNPRKSRDTLATESPDKPRLVIPSDNEDKLSNQEDKLLNQAVKTSRPTKTKVNNHLLVQEELMKECINALKENKPPNDSPPTTEEIFGKFVAEKLKALDRRQRIMAEKKITEILFDLEMENTVTSFNYTPQSTYPTGSASHGQYGYPSLSGSDGYHPCMSTADGQSTLTTLYPWHKN